VYRTVDPAAAQKPGIRRVDDGIDGASRYVTPLDMDIHRKNLSSKGYTRFGPLAISRAAHSGNRAKMPILGV
jgi:hypothetical protein